MSRDQVSGVWHVINVLLWGPAVRAWALSIVAKESDYTYQARSFMAVSADYVFRMWLHAAHAHVDLPDRLQLLFRESDWVISSWSMCLLG
jgi:hypothetical protein